MKRNTLIAAAAAITTLAGVGSASASTLTASNSAVRYVAGIGETNTLTVTRSGTDYLITDPGATITPTAPCVAVNANSARCPAAGIIRLEARLLDGNDQATIDGTVAAVQSVITGDAGNDTILGGDLIDDTLIGDDGNDVISGRGGRDSLFGGIGNDQVSGGAGSDRLGADAGNDTIDGGIDNDNYDATSLADGADVINLGVGDDSVTYRSRTAPLTVTADGVADDGEAGEGDNIGVDVEQLNGGNGNDRMVATPSNAPTSLDGNDGNDTMTGGPSSDDLDGGAGNDVLSGVGGNDTLRGREGADTLDGGAGDDTLINSSNTSDVDIFRGGADTDLLDYSRSAASVSVTLDDVANDGVANENDNVASDVEDVTGTVFDDRLTGNDAANQFDGGDGDDTLVGRGGSDALRGGRGTDTIDGGAGVDALEGGDGADRLLARDGFNDALECGGGVDTALIDRLDDLRGCEATSAGATAARSGRLRSNRFAIAISCPAAEGASCTGTVRLTRRSALGRTQFTIPAGTSRTVSVLLSRSGRRVVSRSVRITAEIAIPGIPGTTRSTVRVRR